MGEIKYPAGSVPRSRMEPVKKKKRYVRRPAPDEIRLRSIETVIAQEGKKITITLGLPPTALNPNRSGKIRAKINAQGRYKAEAYYEALAALRPAGWQCVPRAVEQAHFYQATNVWRDGDNFLIILKKAFDGFTQAKVWVDDRFVRHAPVLFGIDAERPRVEITIWADYDLDSPDAPEPSPA